MKIEFWKEKDGFYFKINGVGIQIDTYSTQRANNFEIARARAITIYKLEREKTSERPY